MNSKVCDSESPAQAASVSFLNSPLLCLVAYAFYAGSTLFWIRADQTPPSWDPADHLTSALQYFRAMHGGAGAFSTEFFRAPHAYAPLYHLMIAGALFLNLQPLEAAALVNLVLLAVIMAVTYGIGRRLFGEQEGLWAALLVPAYPIISWLLHEAFIDLMLVAIVACSLYALLRTDRFHSRKWSIILGATLGLGMLTKQTFGFMLWLPVLWEAVVAVKLTERIRLENFLLALAVGAALAAVWYVPHYADTLAIYGANRSAALQQGHPSSLSILSFLVYPYFLVNYQQQLLFVLLFILGLVYAWRHRRQQAHLLFVLVLGTYVSFTLLTNKNPRYTVPLLAPIAILSVAWLDRPMNAGKMIVIKGAILLGCVASFLWTQWPPTSGEGAYLGSPNRRGPRLILAGYNLLRFDHRPQKSGWPVREIFDDIVTVVGQPADPVRLGVTSNSTFFNPSSFRYYAELSRTYQPGATGIEVDYLIEESDLGRLETCDFVVTRFSSESGEETTPAETAIRRRPEMLSGFRLWKRYSVKDGSEAQVYLGSRINANPRGWAAQQHLTIKAP